jgi:hypothetical protein
MGIRDKPSGFGSSKKAAKMTRIVRLWVGIGLVMVSSGGRNLTTHRLALHQITTETAILLAPAIPEAGAAAQARRVFFTTTETIDLPSDSVVVSSSPDGSGVLCTDDEARLTILRERQPVAVWSHRFFSADRREILCLSPQRLRLPTGPGQYQVQIELEDRYPPTYSSRPYYLVADSAQPSLAPIPVQGVPASPERLPDEPRESPASGRSGQRIAPPARTTMLTAQPLPTGNAQPPLSRAAQETAPRSPRPTWIVVGIGLVIGLIVVPSVVWQRRAQRRSARRSPLAGVVDLYDQETREARTTVFDGRTLLLIQRHPLDLVTAAVATPQQQVIGRIQPDLSAPRLVDGMADLQGTPLDHGSVCSIANGVVTIRFRAASPMPHSAIRTRGVSR